MPSTPPWRAEPLPDDRPEIFSAPVPRPLTARRITVVGPLLLGVLGVASIVGGLYLVSRPMERLGWILPLVLFAVGGSALTVFELVCRRPLALSLHVLRTGTATPGEVTGLELTAWGRLCAWLRPPAAESHPSRPSVLGLPRRLTVRLLAGPRKGDLVEFIVSAEPGIPWVSTGARVTVLLDPSARGKHVLWESAQLWTTWKDAPDQ